MNNGHENHFSQDFTKLLFSLYKKCNILHHNCLTANNYFYGLGEQTLMLYLLGK